MIKTYAIWSKNVAPIENLSTQNLIFTLSAIYETILIFEGGSVSKSQENRFLRPEIVKITISESQNLNLNFNFRGHILNFQAKNTQKSWYFKVENNAQKTPEQL